MPPTKKPPHARRSHRHRPHHHRQSQDPRSRSLSPPPTPPPTPPPPAPKERKSRSSRKVGPKTKSQNSARSASRSFIDGMRTILPCGGVGGCGGSHAAAKQVAFTEKQKQDPNFATPIYDMYRTKTVHGSKPTRNIRPSKQAKQAKPEKPLPDLKVDAFRTVPSHKVEVHTSMARHTSQHPRLSDANNIQGGEQVYPRAMSVEPPRDNAKSRLTHISDFIHIPQRQNTSRVKAAPQQERYPAGRKDYCQFCGSTDPLGAGFGSDGLWLCHGCWQDDGWDGQLSPLSPTLTSARDVDSETLESRINRFERPPKPPSKASAGHDFFDHNTKDKAARASKKERAEKSRIPQHEGSRRKHDDKDEERRTARKPKNLPPAPQSTALPARHRSKQELRSELRSETTTLPIHPALRDLSQTLHRPREPSSIYSRPVTPTPLPEQRQVRARAGFSNLGSLSQSPLAARRLLPREPADSNSSGATFPPAPTSTPVTIVPLVNPARRYMEKQAELTIKRKPVPPPRDIQGEQHVNQIEEENARRYNPSFLGGSRRTSHRNSHSTGARAHTDTKRPSTTRTSTSTRKSRRSESTKVSSFVTDMTEDDHDDDKRNGEEEVGDINDGDSESCGNEVRLRGKYEGQGQDIGGRKGRGKRRSSFYAFYNDVL